MQLAKRGIRNARACAVRIWYFVDCTGGEFTEVLTNRLREPISDFDRKRIPALS